MPSSSRYRKAKIVATAGLTSNTRDVIEGLIAAGVDVVRFNLSHGTLDEHEKVCKLVRESCGRLGRAAGVLFDLQGPRIRTGLLGGGPVEVKPADRLTLTCEEYAEANRVPGLSVTTTYKDLYKDVKPGDRILIDDGLIELKVIEARGKEISCEVVYGGVIKEHKGMNFPGVDISAPSLTDTDRKGIDLAVRLEADYIALSFVRKAADVTDLKKMLHEKGSDIPVIAKIEKAEAVEAIDEILAESDGIMIARGDLGVELGTEHIPVLQKKLISRANEAEKIVITATQMLESMITNPRPTRAEASDVANAVFDGTDALMLSGETAVGSYPVKAVEIMARIINEAEDAKLPDAHMMRRKNGTPASFAHAVCSAAHAASYEVKSKAIVVFTQTGDTARTLSKMRPATRIVAFTPVEKTRSRLALVWGVTPYTIEFGEHTDEMICLGESALLDFGIAGLGDTVVIVSGTKVGMRGATNMMKIDWIGSDECKIYLKGR